MAEGHRRRRRVASSTAASTTASSRRSGQAAHYAPLTPGKPRRIQALSRRRQHYLDRIDKYRTAKRLVRRLDALGYDVMLQPKAAA
jgi:hypothetical protein